MRTKTEKTYTLNLLDQWNSSSVNLFLYDQNQGLVYVSWMTSRDHVYVYAVLPNKWEEFLNRVREDNSVGVALAMRRWYFSGGDAILREEVDFVKVDVEKTQEESKNKFEVHIDFTGTVKIVVDDVSTFAEAEEKAVKLFDTNVMDGVWTPVLVRKVK